jgi:hypothetical protein
VIGDVTGVGIDVVLATTESGVVAGVSGTVDTE